MPASKFTVDCILANGKKEENVDQSNFSSDWDWLKEENEEEEPFLDRKAWKSKKSSPDNLHPKTENGSKYSTNKKWPESMEEPTNPNDESQQKGMMNDPIGDEKTKDCQNQKDLQQMPPPFSSNSPDALLISQWAAQCLRQFLAGNGGGPEIFSQQGDGLLPLNGPQILTLSKGGNQASTSTALALNQPLALAAGTGFPLFQHMQKSKRIRTAFSPGQLVQLEQAFRRSQYLVGSERKHLAKQLALSETQVKVWFQNRRTKSKRFVDDEGGSGCHSPNSTMEMLMKNCENGRMEEEDEDGEGDEQIY